MYSEANGLLGIAIMVQDIKQNTTDERILGDCIVIENAINRLQEKIEYHRNFDFKGLYRHPQKVARERLLEAIIGYGS